MTTFGIKRALKSQLIREIALEEGADLVGIARSRPLEEYRERLSGALSKGYHGGLGYLERNFEKRLDSTLLVDGSKSVICCAVSYNNRAWVEPRGVASYALAADYHDVMRDLLKRIAQRLKEHYPNLSGRVFVDTAPIMEKAWAVESGLGWIGGNSLLITPEFGSFVALGEIVVNLECDDYSEPYKGDGCGTCHRCMDACPTGAIVARSCVDARKCIARATVESVISPVGDVDLHGWLFGCDECQSCCPYNQKAPLFRNKGFTPILYIQQIDQKYWEQLDEEEFNRLFSRSAMSRGGYEALKSRIL